MKFRLLFAWLTLCLVTLLVNYPSEARCVKDEHSPIAFSRGPGPEVNKRRPCLKAPNARPWFPSRTTRSPSLRYDDTRPEIFPTLIPWPPRTTTFGPWRSSRANLCPGEFDHDYTEIPDIPGPPEYPDYPVNPDDYYDNPNQPEPEPDIEPDSRIEPERKPSPEWFTKCSNALQGTLPKSPRYTSWDNYTVTYPPLRPRPPMVPATLSPFPPSEKYPPLPNFGDNFHNV